VWLGPGVARTLTTGEALKLYAEERFEEVLNTKFDDVKPPGSGD
jgi:hypothetical protein